MIRERSELDAIASEIQASDQAVALDLETYGTSEDKKIKKDETLDRWRGEIRLLSLQLPVWSIGELYNAAAKSLEPQGKSVKPRSAWQVMELETPRNRPLSYSGCFGG